MSASSSERWVSTGAGQGSPDKDTGLIDAALSELTSRLEQARVQAADARQRAIVAEAEVERISRAVAALIDLLPQDRRPGIVLGTGARQQEHRQGRGSTVFDNVVELFKSSPHVEWTAPEVQSALEKKGIQTEPKQIHNVLGYLAREGKLVRVDRGRYYVSSYGFGIETSNEPDDYDGGRRSDGE